MTIKRIPATPAAKTFNSDVAKREKFKAVEVDPYSTQFINSATHLDGKTRELIQVNLPPKTVKWFYRVTAYRNKEQLAKESSDYKLLGQLSHAIDATGGIDFAIGILTQPPPADYCDVYLLDNENSTLFMNKDERFASITEGTKTGFESGIMLINSCKLSPCYIGIKNPDKLHGINVDTEVVALVKDVYLEMENQ